MLYTVRLSSRCDHLHITIADDFDAGQALQVVQQTSLMGLKHDIHRYLVDVRGAKNIAGPIENFEFVYTDLLELPYRDPRTRIALIVAAEDQSHDFLTVLAVNGSAYFQIFRDLAVGLAFLNVAE
jgi:hypothetical protein